MLWSGVGGWVIGLGLAAAMRVEVFLKRMLEWLGVWTKMLEKAPKGSNKFPDAQVRKLETIQEQKGWLGAQSILSGLGRGWWARGFCRT